MINDGRDPLSAAAQLMKLMLKLKYLYIPQPMQGIIDTSSTN